MTRKIIKKMRPKNFLAPLFIFLMYFLTVLSTNAQQKNILTTEAIFKSADFRQNSVQGISWMKDGQFYTSKIGDKIIKYNIANGQEVNTLFDGGNEFKFNSYQLSSDENKILLATEEEAIYRRSKKAFYYIYDIKEQKLEQLLEKDKVLYADFSPNGLNIAFVKDNNIFIKNLENGEIIKVTQTGKSNQIIHGSADWVYEEEFGFAKAFTWSPDGSKIAFYTFNESNVKQYNMQLWGTLYPNDYIFKYPKAGEKNAVVQISVYDLQSGKSTVMKTGSDEDIYIPRTYWTSDSKTLSMLRLNRHQNKMEILHSNLQSGDTQVILTEESKTYVDVEFTEELIYLSDNKSFIKTSEKDGFKHIYHYSLQGKLIRQVTKGEWEVDKLLGINEATGTLYYISTEDSPLQRQLYTVKLNGKGKTKLSQKEGTISVNISPDQKYFIEYHSSAREPLTVQLYDGKGKLIRLMEDNKALKARLENYVLPKKEFTTFKAADGTDLNAYLIKPTNFDAKKEYPVLMFVYGGPGSQMVADRWVNSRDLWMKYVAEQGYIIACVDNRGTGARGREFKHVTYMKLGKHEVADQIEAAKQLGNLPFVDSSRIGIWGWSYGGYMSSLALFVGNDVFKTAIAVAPVTNWRFYDTIYTERYLRTPQENPEGYDDYSPMSHTDKLQGNFLLIHGTGDDNVHFQNAVELTEALIQNNKEFETFYYPNKNHGIYGGNTTFHLYNKMTNFIINKL